MSDELYALVDDYIEALFVEPDPALEAAVADSTAAGLPTIQISPVQGRLLHLLAQLTAARRILEIGTLGGYSAIWLARALPADGQLITLELDPKHAAVARANLDRAGVGERAEVRVGPAVDSLAAMAAAGEPPFDVVFIDADKEGYPTYLEWALRLTRSGSLIIADNVLRRSAIPVAEEGDAAGKGIHRFNTLLAAEPRLMATILPTAGHKGFDGLAFARVR